MIAQVETLNYKCLRHIRQPLLPFQVLVGPNASGKSTFLDAFAFFRDLLNDGVEAAVLRRARSTRELVWQQQPEVFELAVEMVVPETLRTAVNGALTRCRYEVRVGADAQQGGIRLRVENLWLKREPVHAPPLPQRSLFPVEPQLPSAIVSEPRAHAPSGWRKVVTRMPEGNVYFRAETTKWNAPFRIDPQKSALANLPEDVERFPVATWARQILREGVQLLALNSLKMREPCRPDAPRAFQPDGSNLPLAVRDLRRDRARFDWWLKHVQTVLDIDDLEVHEREVDRHLYLAARLSTGLRLPSWLLSDGTLRFLALTLLAYLPPESKIHLVEEPENGIHPRALEAVFQSLSSVYDGQILLATHSPLLLALAKREQLLCFARADSGATDIVNGQDHPRLRDWHGESDLGVLFAAGVLG